MAIGHRSQDNYGQWPSGVRMTKNYPSRNLDKFILRLPEGMRDEIAASAKANNRSMNAEIIVRLQSSFNSDRILKKTFGKDEMDDDDGLPEGLSSIPDHLRDIADRLQIGINPRSSKSRRRKRS
jgi:hypothetical protein